MQNFCSRFAISSDYMKRQFQMIFSHLLSSIKVLLKMKVFTIILAIATIGSCSKSDYVSTVWEQFRNLEADLSATAATSKLVLHEIKKCRPSTESLSTVILNRLYLLVQQNIDGASEMYNLALSSPSLTQQLIEYSDLSGFDAAIMATISEELEAQIDNAMLDSFTEGCLKQRAEFFALKFKNINKQFKSVVTNKASQVTDSMSLICKNMDVFAKSLMSVLYKKCGTDGACTLLYVSCYILLQLFKV